MDLSLSKWLKPLIAKIIKYPRVARFCWYKYQPSDFKLEDKLFHAFSSSELDQDNNLNVNAIRFPDFSCNWSKFSKPESVRFRKNGRKTDGCFSITTRVSRYNDMATPCHDPLKDENNYSHIEIRQLDLTENVYFEPPKNRKLEKEKQGWSRTQRLEYRQHLVFNLVKELDPIE